MSDSLRHVLLTRFNLPSVGAESLVRSQEGWLRDRIVLFETYCVPSVRAQTSTKFSWIVYLDPMSPQWLKARVESLSADGTFTPVYRESVSRSDLVADISALGTTIPEELITTNLDNDDGLAVDFVERLQGATTSGSRAAVYLTTGIIRSRTGLYLRTDPLNAFCSVREPWDGAVTCWSDWHNMLGRSMPVVQAAGEPAWLQVVHGANVSNRTRGRLVAATPYQHLFPGLLPSDDDPSGRALALDRFVLAPARAVREGARASLKRVTFALFGRDGLDRAKAVRETLRIKIAGLRGSHITQAGATRPHRG